MGVSDLFSHSCPVSLIKGVVPACVSKCGTTFLDDNITRGYKQHLHPNEHWPYSGFHSTWYVRMNYETCDSRCRYPFFSCFLLSRVSFFVSQYLSFCFFGICRLLCFPGVLNAKICTFSCAFPFFISCFLLLPRLNWTFSLSSLLDL